MAERQQSPDNTYSRLRRCVPPPVLTGFLTLLVVTFCLSYGVGSAAGPVAPGMHSSRSDTTTTTGGDGGSSGRHGHGGAGGTHSGGGR